MPTSSNHDHSGRGCRQRSTWCSPAACRVVLVGVVVVGAVFASVGQPARGSQGCTWTAVVAVASAVSQSLPRPPRDGAWAWIGDGQPPRQVARLVSCDACLQTRLAWRGQVERVLLLSLWLVLEEEEEEEEESRRQSRLVALQTPRAERGQP